MSNTNAAFALGGRFLLAILFILSGLSKLGAAAGTQAYIASAGIPLPVVAYVVAVVVELGGGLMLLVGYRTRTAALALALFTLVAAAFFHNQLGDRNRGMGIVELNRDPARELRKVVVGLEVATDDVGDRAGDEKVLLPQAKLLAGEKIVVRVEHL